MRSNNTSKADNLQKADIHKDKLEQVQYVGEQIKTWTENADNKVSVSFGVFTAVFSIITFLAEQYIKKPNKAEINECLKNVHLGILVISFVLMAIAFFFFIKAIIPNIKVHKGHILKYPVFFGNIQKMGFDEYKKKTMTSTEFDFLDEILYENWINSLICFQKMKNYKRGVFFSSIAVLLAVLALIVRYYMYQ